MNGRKSSVAAFCRLTFFVITLAALSACGGSSSKKYTIGGTISGLTGTVVLQNNGGNNLSRNANGAFTFSGKVKKKKPYAVTVATQPVGQTCVVTNGSGTATANVTNVVVTCTTNPTFNVGGNVGGLTGTVVLRNSGGDDLSLNGNGPFTFATKVPSGAPYAVTVFTQPAGQTCVVTQGTGTMPSADVTNVAVNCTDNPPPPVTYSIGGTVSGLTGGTLQLLLSGGQANPEGVSMNITANGPFTFDPEKVESGMAYTVTVQTQPAGQNCSVTNGAGNANANVTNVAVSCVAATTTYTIGGTISGQTGAGLTIEDGSSNSITKQTPATTFTLPNPVANGFEYDVGIKTQPTGQTCVILKSHGVVNAANVTNVDVKCIDNVTDPIVGTYEVPALIPGSYVYITLFADGVYIYGSMEDNPGALGCGANDGNGVEYGVYSYTASDGTFTFKSAVVDTNGECGVWDSNGARYSGTLQVGGTAGQGRLLTLTVPGAGQIDLVPVPSTTGQIIGSFAFPYEKNFGVFLTAGGNNLYYMMTETQQDAPPTSTGHAAGVEYACASISALTGGTLSPNLGPTCDAPRPGPSGAWDTSGTAGLSDAGATIAVTINADLLTTSGVTYPRIKPN